MIDTGLAGRVALVTGANNPLGIGAAIAAALAAQGVAVAVGCHPIPAPGARIEAEAGAERYAAGRAADGTQVVDAIRAAGGSAERIETDLSDPEGPADAIDRAERALGPVQILVNNASHSEPDTFVPADGRSFYRPSVPLSARTLDEHLAVDARAPALLMAEFFRRHLARSAGWGRVVNLSTDGAAAFPTEVSYGAAKNALESLSRSAAHEFGGAGITVNIVAPGPIQTGWISPQMLPQIESDTPLRRVGTPEDVADVVVFLASDQGRWLTGQTLYVGGGHRMV